MSEKKNKRDIKIPLYNIDSQVAFLEDVCHLANFETPKLMSLILADWIYTFQAGTEKMNGNALQCFYCYLELAERTFKKFQKLKKDLENEKK